MIAVIEFHDTKKFCELRKKKKRQETRHENVSGTERHSVLPPFPCIVLLCSFLKWLLN